MITFKLLKYKTMKLNLQVMTTMAELKYISP